METVFGDASEQTLTSDGKCLWLHFRDQGISVKVYPSYPRSLPKYNGVYTTSTLETVLPFIEAKGLTIEYQNRSLTDPKAFTGLWVNHPNLLMPCYVHVPHAVQVPDVPDKTEMIVLPGPLTATAAQSSTRSRSRLQRWNILNRTVRILKEYSLYTYAIDPTNFSIDSFRVDPDHRYNLLELRGRLSRNELMYDTSGRLIVPTADTATSMFDYVLTMVKNDKLHVESYAVKTYMTPETLYASLSDYRVRPDCTMYTSKDALTKHILDKRNVQDYTLLVSPLPKQREAYYYGPPFLVGRTYKDPAGTVRRLGPCLVQHVESDSLKAAVAVSSVWTSTQSNPGYHYQSFPGSLKSVYVYNPFSQSWKVRTNKRPGTHIALLLEYLPGKYAALLPLETIKYTT